MSTISKQLVCQKYIFKIHSARLRKERWKLTLPIDEARRNDEVISLADSQMLRWIDELNGITDADRRAKEIRSEIRELRKGESGIKVRRRIKELYKQLDEIQFKPDYMCLIIDKEKDYWRACEGFSINGISYVRLVGTVNGVKNSTIVFVSERLAPEIKRRIDNDRDLSKPMVTAKLEAYKALTCSASNPVSTPLGIAVVRDSETSFISDYFYLTDETDGEPEMTMMKDQTINMDASDGFGMMSPLLAGIWSYDLDLDYTVSGLCVRYSFTKGMVFTFDFHEFAETIAESYIIKDAWGDDVDIRDVDLILTTSMVKLWDSYGSCKEFLEASERNGYTFGVTKVCPKELESERTLNYQFIQPYDLTEDDINELIKPTMDEFNEVLHGDWRKSILFLKGIGLTEKAVRRLPNDYIKAIMINPEVINDPYIQNSVYQLIHKKINEAKVGVIKVHGNYSIATGDPYLLCESMFGMEPRGLLSAGEVFNRYWADCGAVNLACYRAPMSDASNIRKVTVADNIRVRYWYRFMKTCTVFNSWDTAAASLNGMDFDGDMVMLTDNSVLVGRLVMYPTLMCVERRAEKIVADEIATIKSNIASFGNDIGQTTNWITSMYEVRSKFAKDSVEYQTLEYRIKCGQLFQQGAIDRTKGIIVKPMPRSWHDGHALGKITDSRKRDLYRRIIADKKPYFMMYIYPPLMKRYKTFIRNTDRNSLREFGMSVSELIDYVNNNGGTERMNEFLHYYWLKMPVGINDCVMNKICRKFEDAFDGYVGRFNSSHGFDYTILKSGVGYTQSQFNDIKKLYLNYNSRLSKFMAYSKSERIDKESELQGLADMDTEFRRMCDEICPDKNTLCDIILDICYRRSSTKRFAWSMCGDEIIDNLLRRNEYQISYPEECPTGDVLYCGKRFDIKTIGLGEDI